MQNTWVWVVVAVVLIGGGFWWWQNSQAPATSVGTENSVPVDTSAGSQTPAAQSDQGTSVNVGATVAVGTGAMMTATVTYSGTSFTPATVTIKKGGTVTFVDSSNRGIWIASGPHPTHTGYSGTSKDQHCPDTSRTAFDQCGPGASYSFTFQKVGTWPYHDHLNAGVFGKVIVVE